jgi:hypothetical protein
MDLGMAKRRRGRGGNLLEMTWGMQLLESWYAYRMYYQGSR